MLTKDKKERRNQGFQRGWTRKTYCLHKKKKEMADLFFGIRFKGRHREF
jgi:hypothetical protein